MHPKQICNDFASLGSPFVLDGDNLYIKNPENIYPELEELAKNYKARIIAYLKGSYTDIDHKVMQTMDKIITFYNCVERESNEKINDWLQHDDVALKKIMHLFVLLSNNGWYGHEPMDNFVDDSINQLVVEIYKSAVEYTKKGARN